MPAHATDERWMRLALSLGARGLGQTWPNPSVGCVIVNKGRVVGRGWTQPGGRPHAETLALAQAGSAAKDATVYVSLEPCAHHGQTPPCASALITAKVARVVTAITDPDTRVAGNGHKMLEQAGISVTTGILSEQARQDHIGFLTRIRHARPSVTLKLANSLDGKIATRTGDSRWITNATSRGRTHLMRASHDAIMIGSGTALADDPDLQVRLNGLENRSPVRVVLDSKLQMPSTAKMLQSTDQTPVWICHSNTANTRDLADAGASLLPCATTDFGLDLGDVLSKLSDQGITRVFCEGGGTLAASLLQHGLVDQLITFHAGLAIGADGTPSLASMGLDALANAPRFKLLENQVLDQDIMSVWQPI